MTVSHKLHSGQKKIMMGNLEIICLETKEPFSTGKGKCSEVRMSKKKWPHLNTKLMHQFYNFFFFLFLLLKPLPWHIWSRTMMPFKLPSMEKYDIYKNNVSLLPQHTMWILEKSTQKMFPLHLACSNCFFQAHFIFRIVTKAHSLCSNTLQSVFIVWEANNKHRQMNLHKKYP